ncbi:uncharacterized protein LOC144636804 isoform X1 [Oculina patagonica]
MRRMYFKTECSIHSSSQLWRRLCKFSRFWQKQTWLTSIKLNNIQLFRLNFLLLLYIFLANNITTLPPTPDAPILLSSSYFTFTLDWSSYNETNYNASSVVYVLEVTRHENISDPFIMLPHIQKYHVTTNATFTIPEDFVTKTNFSFRLAVVTLQGTSNFSSSSPLYTTNSSCDRSQHAFNESRFFPCPVFNVRLNFTVTPVQYERPSLSTTLSWDFPHDLHANLEEGEIVLDVQLSVDQPNQACFVFGRTDYISYTYPQPPATSYADRIPDEGFYFGCRYDVELYSDYAAVGKFTTSASFYIPQCIHGFCGCERRSISIPEKSDYIHIDIHGNQTSVNKRTANVTWSTEAWNKIPAFFKLVMLECTLGDCPVLGSEHHREIVRADLHGVKTNYSFPFHDLTKDEKHYVLVAAFDHSGCQLSPTEGEVFYAGIPTNVPFTVQTNVLTNQTTVQTTDKNTVPITVQTAVPTTVQTTLQSTDQTTFPTTVQTTLQITNHTTVQTTDQNIVPTTVQTTVPTTNQTTVPTTVLTTVQTTDQTTVPTTVLTTVQTTDQTTIPTTILTTDQTNVLTTVQTIDQTIYQTTVQTTILTTDQTNVLTTVQTIDQTIYQTTIQTTILTTDQTNVLSTVQTIDQTIYQTTVQTTVPTIVLTNVQNNVPTTVPTLVPTTNSGFTVSIDIVMITFAVMCCLKLS